MSQCLFCKIAQGEIPSVKVFEDDLVLAFRDISPQAISHILIIPKQHLSSLNEVDQADESLLARLIKTARIVAQSEGITESGYRLVSNCGPDAMQSVAHLHFHVLGGQQLSGSMA